MNSAYVLSALENVISIFFNLEVIFFQRIAERKENLFLIFWELFKTRKVDAYAATFYSLTN